MRHTTPSTQLSKCALAGLVMLVSARGALSAPADTRCPLELPRNLQLREDLPQSYLLTTDYYSRDIYGKLTGKMRVTGQYTRALPGGAVRWNNVRIATAKDPNGPLPAGQVQEYMEGLTYKPSAEVLDPAFFKGFPPDVMHAKVLVWDALSFEVWAWNDFEELTLNRPYRPDSGNQEFDMAGAGTFRNQDLKLTWVGISAMNDESCALIQYESMFNPLDMDAGPMSIKGRTHYWGNIWVSLKDKQIEHGTLYEDGLIELNFKDGTGKTLTNVLREVAFKKIVTAKPSP